MATIEDVTQRRGHYVLWPIVYEVHNVNFYIIQPVMVCLVEVKAWLEDVYNLYVHIHVYRHILTYLKKLGLFQNVTQKSRLIPFTDWAYNAHSVPFEQSKSAHYVPSL